MYFKYLLYPLQTSSTFADSSNQGLHCLFADILLKMEKKLLKRKWIGPIGKSGTFLVDNMGLKQHV